MFEKPKLRSLDIQPVYHQGQRMWLLRDPLELAETQLVLASPLAQLLIYCDGTRDKEELRQSLSHDLGIPVDFGIISDTVDQLDESFLLDNERSREAMRAQLVAYKGRQSREPSLAGLAYASNPYELTTELLAYGQGDDMDGWHPWTGRGIISPHIDYQRGGEVYSQLWRRAELGVKEAELVIILGTDHFGSNGRITLTTVPYETPFGILPTDTELVAALAEAVGPEAFTEELHHRKEHSVELSATWLHFTNDRRSTPVVPVICGSFSGFMGEQQHPDEDPVVERFIQALRELTLDKKVLAVASVDLAHVGPNFGDDFAMDFLRREQLAQEDKLLIEAIKRGDARSFYDQIAAVGDRNRICGASSIYLLLRYLGATSGQLVAYQHCPADAQDASLVSICGILLE